MSFVDIASPLSFPRFNRIHKADCTWEGLVMSKVFVSGLFKTRAAAEVAIDAIIKRGYTRDDISVLMSDATKNKEFAVQTRSHAADGTGVGGAIGGPAGAQSRVVS